jgi:membrane protein YqaA with SNARE-associated domain
MSLDSVGAELGIYFGTFLYCFVAGLIPVVNAEIWVGGIAAVVATRAPLPAVVVLAAAGQMAAKVLLYYAALGAVSLPTGRYQEKVARARAWVSRWKERPKLVLGASAVTGLPPFYVISLLAGALEIRLRTFLIIGMSGRVVRFGLLAAGVWYLRPS